MDCEKFDRIVLDQLYDELDELTSAAAKRHADHCVRCRRIDAGLRATREVGVLPILEPPADLVSRILTAEREAHAGLPLRRRIGRAISIMASYAMRPQLAMAALLLLMIGGSLLFLRARPGDHGAPQGAERGVPEGEGDSVQAVPVPEKVAAGELGSAAQAHGAITDQREARRDRIKGEDDEGKQKAVASETKPSNAAAAPLATAANLEAEDAGTDVAYGEAMAAFNEGRYADAQRRFEDIASAGGAKAASAALFAAQSARNGAGCGVAAERFEEVTNRFPGTGVGNEAAWQAADCYRALGQFDKARRHYRALLATQYATRAQQALSELDEAGPAIASKSAAKAARQKAEPKAAAAPPAKVDQKAAEPKSKAASETLGF